MICFNDIIVAELVIIFNKLLGQYDFNIISVPGVMSKCSGVIKIFYSRANLEMN